MSIETGDRCWTSSTRLKRTSLWSLTFSTRPSSPAVVFACGKSNVRRTARVVAPGTLYQFSGTPLHRLLLTEKVQPTKPKVSSQLWCTDAQDEGLKNLQCWVDWELQDKSCRLVPHVYWWTGDSWEWPWKVLSLTGFSKWLAGCLKKQAPEKKKYLILNQ